MIDNTFGFKKINLDDVEADYDDYIKMAGVFRDLGRYLLCKAEARDLRKEGNIDDALKFEGRCDKLYRSLPEWAKW